MSQKDTSHSETQNETQNGSQYGAKFDPTRMWMSGMDTWLRIARDNMERVHAFYDDRSAHPFEGRLDPVALWSAGVDTWNQLSRENMERVQGLCDEMLDFEQAAYERAKKGAKDLGAIMTESVDCLTDLAREWRKLGIKAMRRGASAVESKA